MKNGILLGAFMALFFVFTPQRSNACIDTTTVIWVDCHYDTGTFINEVLLRVNNMQLYGSPGGEFCTCAIHNWTNMYSNIQYVAFVDDQTFDPIQGFQDWSASTAAGTDWNNVQAGNWEGFLSETIGGGLPGGQPVDLIIRAQLPPGYTFNTLDSTLTQSDLGTDGWDDLNQEVALHHTNIVNFTSGGAVSYIVEDSTWFDSIDFHIATAGLPQLDLGLSVYPNPAKEFVTIDGLTQTAFVRIFNSAGVLVKEGYTNKDVKLNGLESGIYFLMISIPDQGMQTIKFIKE